MLFLLLSLLFSFELKECLRHRPRFISARVSISCYDSDIPDGWTSSDLVYMWKDQTALQFAGPGPTGG